MPKSTSKPSPVSAQFLRDWPLPAVGDSKYGRGSVVVIGGARRTPGAAMLAGIASLRVGAGRLTFGVDGAVADNVAVAVVESGVVGIDLGESSGRPLEALAKDVGGADCVLVGPGLDTPESAEAIVQAIPALMNDDAILVLDAFALGVLPGLDGVVEAMEGRLVLTPNKDEAQRLLGRDIDDLDDDVAEIAERYSAVVTCYGSIADARGARWNVGTGSNGLATSGSGDVLAGAVAGLIARGATAAQSAVWGTHVHGAAGDRLSVDVAPLGYLASELLAELPRVLLELGA
jgi:ADP-dependent NAD(P)H-hydrate dehydratase